MNKEVIYKFYDLESLTQEELNGLARERNTLAEENKQLKEDKKKAREYIKEHQRKDEFLYLNEWQTRDLLEILEEEYEFRRN